MTRKQHLLEAAAEKFGVPPDDVPYYVAAVDECMQVGADAFIDRVHAEAAAAAGAARRGAPILTDDTRRRLAARRDVCRVALEFLEHAIAQDLAAFEGPVH